MHKNTLNITNINESIKRARINVFLLTSGFLLLFCCYFVVKNKIEILLYYIDCRKTITIRKINNIKQRLFAIVFLHHSVSLAISWRVFWEIGM